MSNLGSFQYKYFFINSIFLPEVQFFETLVSVLRLILNTRAFFAVDNFGTPKVRKRSTDIFENLGSGEAAPKEYALYLKKLSNI